MKNQFAMKAKFWTNQAKVFELHDEKQRNPLLSMRIKSEAVVSDLKSIYMNILLAYFRESLYYKV